MSKTSLKVKIKSLAQEARIIRHEELKFPSRLQRRLEAVYNEVQSHRIMRHAKQRNVKLNSQLRHAVRRGVKRDNPEYTSLHFHRTVEVRTAARAALLAYGMMRGREYLRIEKKCYSEPDWTKVRDNLATFASMSKHDAERDVIFWRKGEPKPTA